MRVSVNLKWGAVSAPDLAGYTIHWAAKDGPVTTLTVEKEVTLLTLVLDLQPMVHYAFLVSSYDVAGNHSTKRLVTTAFVA